MGFALRWNIPLSRLTVTLKPQRFRVGSEVLYMQTARNSVTAWVCAIFVHQPTLASPRKQVPRSLCTNRPELSDCVGSRYFCPLANSRDSSENSEKLWGALGPSPLLLDCQIASSHLATRTGLFSFPFFDRFRMEVTIRRALLREN